MKVDPKTGALRFKHKEPNMNDICVLLTFLFRCNHNCTCLLSGSAVNHIVYYITEYITKMGPPTHTVFDAIKSVFDKGQDIMCSGASDIEVARHLMTRVVNKVAMKMELGAPMIAMYLLGNPDHYTSHRFRPFFWRMYYNSIHQYWTGLDIEEKVMVVRKKGHIVGISESQNYVFRADELSHLKLYDFMLLCQRVKIPKDGASSASRAEGDVDKEPTRSLELETPTEDDKDQDEYEKTSWLASSDDEEDESVKEDNTEESSDSEGSGDSLKQKQHENVDDDCVKTENPATDAQVAEDGDMDIEMDEPVDEIPKVFGYPPKEPLKNTFQYGHSLASDYCMKIRGEIDPYLVLNFMCLLPRSNSENCNEYIRVMLMLFKPWRHACDLKDEDESWEDTFARHPFTERELDLMKNFNLRWECIDGRDSFRDNMKRGNFEDRDNIPVYGDSVDDITREVNVSEVVETAFPTEDSQDDAALINKKYTRNSDMYHGIQALMMRQQWGVARPGALKAPEDCILVRLMPRQWQNLLSKLKKEIVDLQTACFASTSAVAPLVGVTPIVGADCPR